MFILQFLTRVNQKRCWYIEGYAKILIVYNSGAGNIKTIDMYNTLLNKCQFDVLPVSIAFYYSVISSYLFLNYPNELLGKKSRPQFYILFTLCIMNVNYYCYFCADIKNLIR